VLVTYVTVRVTYVTLLVTDATVLVTSVSVSVTFVTLLVPDATVLVTYAAKAASLSLRLLRISKRSGPGLKLRNLLCYGCQPFAEDTVAVGIVPALLDRAPGRAGQGIRKTILFLVYVLLLQNNEVARCYSFWLVSGGEC
jgi:hypothetical protein